MKRCIKCGRFWSESVSKWVKKPAGSQNDPTTSLSICKDCKKAK